MTAKRRKNSSDNVESTADVNTAGESQDAALEQFPSLEGEPGVEVAQRGADNHEESTMTHRKVFVIPADQWNEDDPGDMHDNNIRATRQEMMNLGLRPTGDVSFDGAHPDEEDDRSVHLVYTVPAEPAVTADEYYVEHAMVREEEQALLEAGDPDPRGTYTDEMNVTPEENVDNDK